MGTDGKRQNKTYGLITQGQAAKRARYIRLPARFT